MRRETLREAKERIASEAFADMCQVLSKKLDLFTERLRSAHRAVDAFTAKLKRLQEEQEKR